MPTQLKSRKATHILTDELIERIKAPNAIDAPYILQDRVAQTRSRHVAVIWNRWKDIDRSHRSKFIIDAYEKAGVLGADSVMVAIGLTEQEAMQMGYLPYSIVTLRKSSDPVSPAQLKQAMQSIGGVHLRDGSHLQLRFPTQELAQEAYRQLAQKIPGPYWAIQGETAA